MQTYDDVYKTPGAFSWTELHTSDPAAAAKFYGALFGWSFDEMNMGEGGAYRVAKVGNTAIGGIMKAPAPDMPACWGCYVTVANIEATLQQVAALGGKLLVPVMDVPQVGRMAVVSDPQGAVFNVMQYAAP